MQVSPFARGRLQAAPAPPSVHRQHLNWSFFEHSSAEDALPALAHMPRHQALLPPCVCRHRRKEAAAAAHTARSCVSAVCPRVPVTARGDGEGGGVLCAAGPAPMAGAFWCCCYRSTRPPHRKGARYVLCQMQRCQAEAKLSLGAHAPPHKAHARASPTPGRACQAPGAHPLPRAPPHCMAWRDPIAGAKGRRQPNQGEERTGLKAHLPAGSGFGSGPPVRATHLPNLHASMQSIAMHCIWSSAQPLQPPQPRFWQCVFGSNGAKPRVHDSAHSPSPKVGMAGVGRGFSCAAARAAQAAASRRAYVFAIVAESGGVA